MKIAVVGSRGISSIDIGKYTSDADEIVSGGAVGVDFCAAEYAKNKGLKLTVFLPQYELYGRAAPIVRNKKIVDYADKIVVFWDGQSKGTLSVIKYSQKTGKPCEIILCK
jgi:predicted Rossmann fold nucleotide-binding protein DprA/Smf involved in DNA uptake